MILDQPLAPSGSPVPHWHGQVCDSGTKKSEKARTRETSFFIGKGSIEEQKEEGGKTKNSHDHLFDLAFPGLPCEPCEGNFTKSSQ